MIILKQKFNPLIRVIQPELNYYALQEAIEEYIEENSQPTYFQGQLVDALQVTGQSQKHAADLVNYLNHHSDVPYEFNAVKGYFADYNLGNHFWIASEQLLIDLAIKQFANYPQLPDDLLADFGNHCYLICDNPDDPLHRLYIEEVE